MIKVVIFLDCDECGHSINTASVSSLPERSSWEREIGVLMHDAELNGWRFFREYGICPHCIQVELAMSDLYSDEEQYRS